MTRDQENAVVLLAVVVVAALVLFFSNSAYHNGISRGTNNHACKPQGAVLVDDTLCVRPDSAWVIVR